MIKQSTHLKFWVLIPIVLLLALIFNAPFDLILHDTYLVTNRFQISILIAIFLFVSGIGYYLCRDKQMSKRLTNFHFRFTMAGLILILICEILKIFIDQNSSRGDFIEHKNIEAYLLLTMGNLVALVLIAIGFIFYFLNILKTKFAYT